MLKAGDPHVCFKNASSQQIFKQSPVNSVRIYRSEKLAVVCVLFEIITAVNSPTSLAEVFDN